MEFVDKIRGLVRAGRVRASDHAYGRLQEKGISYRQLVSSLDEAEIIERYPEYRHGPCFLARHVLRDRAIAHAVWGTPRGAGEFAVLVTAYWPDKREWDDTMRKRR